ncbi:MAG: bifunctional UDP-N-acetylmuramoyl-tripeptide:D-alanyl-D-alanine ligase/alanine racemase [Bacteroidota bacterium]
MDASVTSFPYSLSGLTKAVKGKIWTTRKDDPTVKQLLIDSRKFSSHDQCLFIALVSRRNDGHRFLRELYQKGIRLFMVTELPVNKEEYANSSFLQVPDTLKALQALAAFHRKQFHTPVIGITGSNGKTIVKEWLFQLIGDDKKIVRSPKSYNSQIGVPLSVWQLRSEDELAIFEAGISEPDEMDKIQAIIQPTIGIFTNIGHAHDENFINLAQKVAEKLKLFTRVEVLIFNGDQVDIMERIAQTQTFRKTRLFTWGRRPGMDLLVGDIRQSRRFTEINASFGGQSFQIRIPFQDNASIENAIQCWACLLYLGYPHEIIAARMIRLVPIAMRLELKEGINNCSIINDSYSSDLDSLSIALDFLKLQKQHRKRTVILSDILQSGKNENDLYGEIAELLQNKNIDRLVGIGAAISKQSAKFKMEKLFFGSTDDFLRKFPFSGFHAETILIKGARAFEFEKIGKALQQKAHETVLEINLNALINNFNVIRSSLDPATKIMVMVKAFSYGSGSFEIANVLQYHHADYLAVAFADEGVELRKAGITLPIMVMNPDEESMDAFAKYDLEPEVYSFRILEMLEESRERVYGDQKKALLVHVKVDTGMHRLGFGESDIPELISRLQKNKNIKAISVFTHLAASQDPAHDNFTLEQIETFSRIANALDHGLDVSLLRHVLNSAGISRFPQAQFGMVRLGISLYGVATDESQAALLQNVSSLRSSISQLKKIPTGDSVGYNRSFFARRDMTIAIVPIGYADGLSRKLGNSKGKMVVSNHLCPIIGEVCMDMCMLDVTGLNVREGDPVIVFGDIYPITRFASDLKTIPYEVLTGISRRVKRIYYQE